MQRMRRYFNCVVDAWFELFWEMPFLGRFWLVFSTLFVISGVVKLTLSLVNIL